MQSLTTTRKDSRFRQQKLENKTTSRAKILNKHCLKARLWYLQELQPGRKASKATSRVACFALLSGSPDLLDSFFRLFV